MQKINPYITLSHSKINENNRWNLDGNEIGKLLPISLSIFLYFKERN